MKEKVLKRIIPSRVINFLWSKINSIYYDTPNFQFARETSDGITQRQKIRIRYYGRLDELKLPKLEIKSIFKRKTIKSLSTK